MPKKKAVPERSELVEVAKIPVRDTLMPIEPQPADGHSGQGSESLMVHLRNLDPKRNPGD